MHERIHVFTHSIFSSQFFEHKYTGFVCCLSLSNKFLFTADDIVDAIVAALLIQIMQQETGKTIKKGTKHYVWTLMRDNAQ